MKDQDLSRIRCEFCDVIVYNDSDRINGAQNLCVVCNVQHKTTYCINCEDEFSDSSNEEKLCESCYELMKKEDTTRDNIVDYNVSRLIKQINEFEEYLRKDLDLGADHPDIILTENFKEILQKVKRMEEIKKK